MDVDDYPDDDGEDYSMPVDEEQRIEVWNMEQFMRQGFDGEAIAKLLEWRVDPHDSERIMLRDGVRTECSIELALEILSPVPV